MAGPSLGKTAAVAVEAPFLLAAMMVAAWKVPKWTGLNTSVGPLAAMGIGALILQQVADVAVALGLRGMTVSEQLASFATPEGLIYLALVIVFAAMPVLIHLRR